MMLQPHRNLNFISRFSSNILDQHDLISWSFISGHVAKTLYQSDLSALKNIHQTFSWTCFFFFGGSLPKKYTIETSVRNFTVHCLDLDYEFQLAKIHVQRLGGTPGTLDGDLYGKPWFVCMQRSASLQPFSAAAKGRPK